MTYGTVVWTEAKAIASPTACTPHHNETLLTLRSSQLWLGDVGGLDDDDDGIGLEDFDDEDGLELEDFGEEFGEDFGEDFVEDFGEDSASGTLLETSLLLARP